MSTNGSITGWFVSLRGGNREAAQELWERFAVRLIRLARARLQSRQRQVADEEDAVLSAFDSFCRGAEQGHFAQLQDRGDLWNLLVIMTVRKVSDQITHETRQKRGGGAVRCETDLAVRNGGFQALDELLGAAPTPQFAAEMTEQCQRLLDLLRDADLRSIALWKMEGYTNEEIADMLQCARSTIQRKLNLIRARWEQESGLDQANPSGDFQ